MKNIDKTNLKLESEEQLKNCEDMHIWVQPIKEYIKKLETKSDRLIQVSVVLCVLFIIYIIRIYIIYDIPLR